MPSPEALGFAELLRKAPKMVDMAFWVWPGMQHFDQLLDERGRDTHPVEAWSALLLGGDALRHVADLVSAQADLGFTVAGCPRAAEALARETTSVRDRFAAIEAALRDGGPPRPRSEPPPGERRLAVADCLRAWGGAPGSPLARTAVGAVWVGDWLAQLDGLCRWLEARRVRPTAT